MDYQFLTEDQQKQIRNQTLANIEGEFEGTKIALARAEAAGDEAQAEGFRKNMESLDRQYAALSA